MNDHPLSNLIRMHSPRTEEDYKYALRRTLQEITLLGLWRGGFFEYTAFYGGTALNIFYDLDRFSEDLDFSLLEERADFRLSSCINSVKNELLSWGIRAEVAPVEKVTDKIESAFVKVDTLRTFFDLAVPNEILDTLHREEKISVKFEIDPSPPCSFQSEFKILLNPLPFNVRLMSLPDLYAGKMHALLARSWRERVKGCDWYDFVWFLKQKTPLNLKHLEARLKQSGHLSDKETLTLSLLKELLLKRIEEVDFSKAKEDVLPFIKDSRQLENWSGDFFSNLVNLIIVKQ